MLFSRGSEKITPIIEMTTKTRNILSKKFFLIYLELQIYFLSYEQNLQSHPTLIKQRLTPEDASQYKLIYSNDFWIWRLSAAIITASHNRVAQAAPIVPYEGIQIRLRTIFKTVAPTKFQVLIISRPDVMRIFDNKKFMKNRKIAHDKILSTAMEGKNWSP